MYYVYVLENQQGRLYIGHTDDVTRRLRQHNSPEGKEHLGKYTHKNGPWSLIGSEAFHYFLANWLQRHTVDKGIFEALELVELDDSAVLAQAVDSVSAIRLE